MVLETAVSVTKHASTQFCDTGKRCMFRAELMGSHTHLTLAGIKVHVWRRDGKYLARGRYERQPFGETLGDDPVHAAARLRDILTKIDNGSYVRPSDGRKQIIARGRPTRLTLRELVADFVAEKRRSRPANGGRLRRSLGTGPRLRGDDRQREALALGR
jgi:hypothetical protein